MKKVFTFAFIAFFTIGISAQEKGMINENDLKSSVSDESAMNDHTFHLDVKTLADYDIELNDTQVRKLTALNAVLATEAKSIKENFKSNDPTYTEKMNALLDSQDKELKDILNEDHYMKFLEMQSAARAGSK